MKYTYLIISVLVSLCLGACGGSSNSKENEKTEANTDTSSKPKVEDSEKIDPKQAKAKNAIQAYCDAFNEGDFDKTAMLFAPEVKQWITMKNTTAKAVSQEAKRFLGKKKNVNYQADFKAMVIEDNKAIVPISLAWEGYEANVEAEIEFDEGFRILSYKEKSIKKQKGKINNASSDKGKALQQITDIPLPYKIGDATSLSNDQSMKWTIGIGGANSEEMKLFEADYDNQITKLLGKFKINEKVYAVIADNSYRFSSDYTLTTYDVEGEKIDSKGFGDNASQAGDVSKMPTIDKNFKFRYGTNNYQISSSGNIEKQ